MPEAHKTRAGRALQVGSKLRPGFQRVAGFEQLLTRCDQMRRPLDFSQNSEPAQEQTRVQYYRILCAGLPGNARVRGHSAGAAAWPRVGPRHTYCVASCCMTRWHGYRPAAQALSRAGSASIAMAAQAQEMASTSTQYFAETAQNRQSILLGHQ